MDKLHKWSDSCRLQHVTVRQSEYLLSCLTETFQRSKNTSLSLYQSSSSTFKFIRKTITLSSTHKAVVSINRDV